jgi:hypothetical protein
MRRENEQTLATEITEATEWPGAQLPGRLFFYLFELSVLCGGI